MREVERDHGPTRSAAASGAAQMKQPVDRYTWQQVVYSEHGPRSAVARTILIAVSLHMDANGQNAWPSQATIARRALVSPRSVVAKLEAAEHDGWIARYEAGRSGKGWRLYRYEATVPDAVYETLPEKPWEADPTWQRRASSASPCTERSASSESRSPQGGANGGGKVVQTGPDGGAKVAEGSAPGAHKSSLLNLPSESSLRRNVRRTRTAGRKSVLQIDEQDPEVQRRRKLADAEIERLAREKALPK
jgi:hypothetical protein